MPQLAPQSSESEDDFVPMERTRKLLGEIWNHWRNTLGHTPEVAERMMDAAIEELHKSELYGVKAKAKSVVRQLKTSAKSNLKTAKNKVKAKVKSKLKAKVKAKVKSKIKSKVKSKVKKALR